MLSRVTETDRREDPSLTVKRHNLAASKVSSLLLNLSIADLTASKATPAVLEIGRPPTEYNL